MFINNSGAVEKKAFFKNLFFPLLVLMAVYLPESLQLVDFTSPRHAAVIFSAGLLIIICALLLNLYFNSVRLFVTGWLVLLVTLATAVQQFQVLISLPEIFVELIAAHLSTLPLIVPLLVIFIHVTRERDVFTGLTLVYLFALTIFFTLLWPAFALGFKTTSNILLSSELLLPLPFIGLDLSIPVLPAGLLLFLAFVLLFKLERSFYVHNQFFLFWIALGAAVPFLGVGKSEQLDSFNLWLLATSWLFVLVISVAHAWNKAYLDPLTQIRGRMALNEKLSRLRGVYSIAMIDIDHFKKFNDQYGHDAGDRVLQQVAELLEKESSATAYRFGGEEFTLIYPGLHVEEVEAELQGIRTAVENNRVGVTRKSKRAKKVLWKQVTVSIGLSDSTDKFEDPDEVLNAADNALFKAKDEGRNRLVVKK